MRSFVLAVLLASSTAQAAPPPPRGGHPRLFLSQGTLDLMKSKLGDTTSGAARVVAKCKDAAARPQNFNRNDEWEWAIGASSCALAYRLTGDTAHVAPGTRLLNALLDDYESIGDGAGGDDVVRHDTGFWLRIHAPYVAMAYDWMHDQLSDSVKSHARARMKAWIDWYSKDGYLKDTPGSNYHAGYAFSKALIGVAMAGEDSAADGYFADAHDSIYKGVIIGKGLAEGGVLQGGDWPEGWQYGPLSVLEYALGARALEEQGAQLPEVRAWASSVTLAYLYAVPPKKGGVFTSGDLDNEEPLARLNPRPLLATAGGMGSDQAASWALHFKANAIKNREENPVYEAIGEARNVQPVDFASTKPSLWYLIKGTRKLFARSGWDENATWAFFTACPNLVPDHQHPDASNFVFSRGADHLIVDPSPYGSLSSLTSNTLTVDSSTVGTRHRPGQSVWENKAALLWARATQSGIAASRADLAGAFSGRDGKSDVPFARRDWTFLPEGDIVTIDRARTDDQRKMHVRFRTPAQLKISSQAPFITSGGVGSSALFIHAVKLSNGTPQQRSIGAGDCEGVEWGVCDAARFPVTEYFVDVTGPQQLAVHVMDGLGPSDQGPAVKAMEDVDPANTGVTGASLLRGSTQTYVVASSAKDGHAGGSLSYTIPGGGPSRHVVFDAPEDAEGRSKVETRVESGKCVVTLTPGEGFAGRPIVFSVDGASDGCRAIEDRTIAPGSVDPNGNAPEGNGSRPGGEGESGCGCGVASHANLGAWAALLALGAVLARRRRA
jgi:MYXO-CTERM domain-containing protein